MFDGVKIEIKDGVTHTSLLNNQLLDFTALHKVSGEEISEAEKSGNSRFTYKYAEYKGLKLKVFEVVE